MYRNGPYPGADPGSVAVLEKWRVLAMEVIDRRRRTLGQNLWDRPFPEDFKRLYATERADRRGAPCWRFPSSPCRGNWSGCTGTTGSYEEPWCLALRMSRWLAARCSGLFGMRACRRRSSQPIEIPGKIVCHADPPVEQQIPEVETLVVDLRMARFARVLIEPQQEWTQLMSVPRDVGAEVT